MFLRASRARRAEPGAEVVYGTFYYKDIWKDEHKFRFVMRVDGQTRPDITGVHDDFKLWN
jgi:hypothetical protein